MSAPLRIVIKLGTSTLTTGSPHLNRAQMLEIVRAAAKLQQQGHQILVVSSGAMAAGRELLHDPKLPAQLSSKQMLASVGQGRLIEVWESLFAIYGLHIGQILLTRADLESRERYLNAKDTLGAMLEHGIVPVINENDALSTQEIRVGDNDTLAALVGTLADADMIILLTDQKGLYTADPRSNPQAKLIRKVHAIDDNLMALAGGAGSAQGTGGMYTKLQAARLALEAGIELLIASGHDPATIVDLVHGQGDCTRFIPAHKGAQARKLWLNALKPQGTLKIDAGAVAALQQQGSSLLPSGVVAVHGEFSRGSAVLIVDPNDKPLAQGLARYNAEDLRRIAGHRSDDIVTLLGYSRGAVVVHRDNLVML
ncbi:MAG: glutamate 5-kinase [Candidatus Anaerobiospirillum merdipullorum]|uniref:Glutamate 5-kinase n=1 Tax=Candidatus Anaerobiospirillum merdipullorum TaxID=2838450 RepID=A0A9E2NTV6_9GAMM|nr:glutamate 5-kinase [Candidatus Anaerobiospirillum merdipullorum]